MAEITKGRLLPTMECPHCGKNVCVFLHYATSLKPQRFECLECHEKWEEK